TFRVEVYVTLSDRSWHHRRSSIQHSVVKNARPFQAIAPERLRNATSEQPRRSRKPRLQGKHPRREACCGLRSNLDQESSLERSPETSRLYMQLGLLPCPR